MIISSGLISAKVKTGLDNLIRQDFSQLKDLKVALVTNHSALSSKGKHIIDIFNRAKKVDLIKIFTPEHGLSGQIDSNVKNSIHRNGIPIISLYGKNKKPQSKDIADVDVFVFDIQDVGTRYYTYISTLAFVMKAAGKHNKKVIVLDRPNPIGGEVVSGFISEKKVFRSFLPLFFLYLPDTA